MIASLITLEGAGAVAFGAVAGSLGVPAAYLIAGLTELTAGIIGLACTRLRPRALDVSRPKTAATSSAGPGGPGRAASRDSRSGSGAG